MEAEQRTEEKGIKIDVWHIKTTKNNKIQIISFVLVQYIRLFHGKTLFLHSQIKVLTT